MRFLRERRLVIFTLDGNTCKSQLPFVTIQNYGLRFREKAVVKNGARREGVRAPLENASFLLTSGGAECSINMVISALKTAAASVEEVWSSQPE